MKSSDIERFFKELDQRITFPLQVVLTGGAAAALFGSARPTEDIDFEVHLKIDARSKSQAWTNLAAKLDEVARMTRITPQYAEDIDRWSSIIFPSKKSRLWKQIGKIEVRLLDPGLWAVGKLARYLSSDEKDLAGVLGGGKSNPVQLVRLWGRALGRSPASSAQPMFRRHVQQFITEFAVKLWGRKVDPDKLMRLFLESARKEKNR